MPKFFKVFFPHKSSHHLKIPPPFCKYLDGANLTTFTLTGPSGNKWKVKLPQENKGRHEEHVYLFEKGWNDFVVDHSLQFGDLLVFKFDRNDNFFVTIFDQTCCEKESTYTTTKPPCSCYCKCNKGKMKVEEEVISMSESKNESNELSLEHVEVGNEVKKRKRERPRKEYWKIHNNRVGKSKLKPQRRQVTQREIKRTLTKAQLFQSSKPFFMTVMGKSHVHPGTVVRIPNYFMREHFSHFKGEIRLREANGGGLWIVGVVPNRDGKYITAGWRKFSRGNNLEEGDVCVFELLSKTEMMVHIFRVV